MTRATLRRAGWLLERVFVCASMLLMTNAVVGLYVTDARQVALDHSSGSALFQGLAGAVYGVSALIVLVHHKRFLSLVRRNLVVIAIVLLALLSVLWSVNPGVSLRRAAALSGTTLFALYLAMRFTKAELLRMVGIVLGLAMIASLVLVFMMPSWGIQQEGAHVGHWRGAFVHKNDFGRWMALAAIVYMVLAMQARRYRAGLVVLAIFTTWIMLHAGSATGTALVMLGIGTLLLIKVIRSRPSLGIPAAVVAGLGLVAALLVISSPGEGLLGFLGRDVTLTGRTRLWERSIEFGVERPWVGYGYEAVWLGDDGAAAELPSGYWGRDTSHVHNGYLGVWLELGNVGVALLGLMLLVFAARSARSIRRPGIVNVWPMIFLVHMLARGVVAPAFVDVNALGWVLLVAVYASMSQEEEAVPAMPARQRGSSPAKGPPPAAHAMSAIALPAPLREDGDVRSPGR